MDLSKLSDEQLEVYRDLLAAKQQPGPGPAKPPLPEGLKPESEQKNSFWSSPHGLIRTGLRNMGEGVEALASGDKARGLSNLIEGAGTALAPAALPFALSNPASTALAAGLGLGAGRGTQALAEKAGASPDTARLAGDIGGLVAGPVTAKGLSMAARAAAEPLAESALGIRGAARAYGSTPGKAILEDTRGIRPATVAKSAQQTINRVTPQMESHVSAATRPVSLTPARDLVTTGWMRAAGEGNLPLSSQIEEMGTALSKNRVTGQPYGPTISPSEALDLKRGFGDEFANYNPNIHERANALAKDVRGNLNQQIHTAAPGAAELDQRIQSLIPVTRRGRMTSLNSGVGTRMLERAGRPTGGLFPLLFGYHEGGIPGALAAIGGTEGISSPEVKMFGARGLFSGSRGLVSPGAAAGSTLVPLIRKPDGSFGLSDGQ